MDNFETSNLFIEKWLAQNRFSKDAIMEAKLLFEALFRDIIEQGFEGKTYVPVKKSKDKISPESRIFRAIS